MKTNPIDGPRVRQWKEDLDGSSTEIAARAALRLGRHLLAVGDGEGAHLLKQATRADDPRIGAHAAWTLAEAYRVAGNSELAQAYQERAESLSEGQFVPHVALSLASRYAALGEVDRAISSYQRLIEEGSDEDREVVGLAAFRLSDLLFERRSYGGAVWLLRKAISDGSPSVRAHAMSDLADFIVACTRHDAEKVEVPAGLPADVHALREAAETLYQRVIESDHPDLAPRAGFYLAELRQDAEEWIAAEEVLRKVVDSEHPVYKPMAEQRLYEAEQRASVEAAIDEFVEEVLAPPQLSFAAWVNEELAWETTSLPVPFGALLPSGDDFCISTERQTYVLLLHIVGPRRERSIGSIHDGLEVWQHVQHWRASVIQPHIVECISYPCGPNLMTQTISNIARMQASCGVLLASEGSPRSTVADL